jgi:hypothetical protein
MAPEFVAVIVFSFRKPLYWHRLPYDASGRLHRVQRAHAFHGNEFVLQPFAFRSKQGGVQRLVVVVFWIGNVIVKFTGKVRPDVMDDAKRGVALTNIANQAANSTRIKDLLKAYIVALHFSPNAVNMIWPSRNFSMKAVVPKGFLKRGLNVGDKFFSFSSFFVQPLGNLLI